MPKPPVRSVKVPADAGVLFCAGCSCSVCSRLVIISAFILCRCLGGALFQRKVGGVEYMLVLGPCGYLLFGNLPAGNLCDGGGHVYRRVAACLQGKAAHVVAAMLADEAEGVLG